MRLCGDATLVGGAKCNRELADLYSFRARHVALVFRNESYKVVKLRHTESVGRMREGYLYQRSNVVEVCRGRGKFQHAVTDAISVNVHEDLMHVGI